METPPVRLLLIEDNPGDALLVREALRGSATIRTELTTAGSLGEGLAVLDRGGIDVVLLDLTLPDSDGIETFRSVRDHARGIPAIVLSGIADEALAVQAVREGAQDYLVKGDVPGHLLVRAIRYGIERQRAMAGGRPGVALAVMGAKGGVGATSFALNLAAALATADERVILLELQEYAGTLADMLRTTPMLDIGRLYANGEHTPQLSELAAALGSFPFGVQVLFAPQRATEVPKLTAENVGMLLGALSGMASYVVIDLHASPAEYLRAAVSAAAFAGIIIDPEPYSVAAANRQVELLRGWGLSGSAIGAIAVHRGNPNALNATELRDLLACELMGSVPPAVEAFTLASRLGIPALTARPESTFAGSMRELAEKFQRVFAAQR